MSPATLSHGGALRAALRRAVPVTLATISAVAFAAPAADAAVSKMSFTDPAGDANGYDALDLLSGSATYDNVAGALSVTVVTKAVFNTMPNGSAMQISFGQTTATGCTNDNQDGSDVALIYAAQGQEISAWTVVGTESGDQATLSHPTATSTTVSATNAAMAGKTLDCFVVRTAAQGATPDASIIEGDSATSLGASTGSSGGSTGGSSGGSTGGSTGGSSGGSTSGTPSAPVTTSLPDADRDGTPDSLDVCRTIPGAQKNGCPAMPAKLEVRLGAKRVVVDKLVLRTTATTCPAKVRVRVTAKGKRVASGLVVTSQFGAYCRVDGVVAFKKKLKKSVKAVRVTMKSTGIGSIAKSAHR